jgi:MFS family permease
VPDSTSFSIPRSLGLPVLAPTALAYGSEGAAMVVLTFAALDLGAAPGTAAAVGGLVGLGGLLGSVPAGRLVTRYGDRRVLLTSLLLLAAVWTAATAARSTEALAVAALVGGLSSAGFVPARQAYTIEHTPSGHRGRAMAALGGAGRAGLVVGPLAIGWVVPWAGVRPGFLVSAGFAILGAAVVALTVRVDEGTPSGQSTAPPAGVLAVAAAHRGTLLSVGVGAMVLSAARSLRPVLVPLAAGHVGLSAGHAGFLVGSAAAVELALFLPAGMGADRWGRRVVATSSLAVMASGVLALAAMQSPPGVATAALLLAVGSGLGAGIVKTLGADLAPVADRATFLGVWGLLAEAGSAGGPLLLAALFALVPFGAATALTGLLCLAGAGWLDRAITIHTHHDRSST